MKNDIRCEYNTKKSCVPQNCAAQFCTHKNFLSLDAKKVNKKRITALAKGRQ